MSGQRQKAASKAPQDVCAADSGCVMSESVDNVQLNAEKGHHEPSCKDCNAYVRQDPENSTIGRPSVHKQTTGNQQRTWNQKRHTKLRNSVSIFATVRQLLIDLVHTDTRHHKPENGTDSERDEVEACNGSVLVVYFDEKCPK